MLLPFRIKYFVQHWLISHPGSTGMEQTSFLIVCLLLISSLLVWCPSTANTTLVWQEYQYGSFTINSYASCLQEQWSNRSRKEISFFSDKHWPSKTTAKKSYWCQIEVRYLSKFHIGWHSRKRGRNCSRYSWQESAEKIDDHKYGGFYGRLIIPQM